MEQTVQEDAGAILEQLAYKHILPFAVEAENLKTVKVTLTNAEIKALAASPKTLVAAPGANKLLEFVSGMARVVAGTEVLAEDGAGSDLAVKYTDDSGVAVSEDVLATGWLDQLTNAVTSIVAKKDAIVADEAGCVNQALVLDNIGGEIVGNASADATMEVFITYRTHDLS
jgi:hypothetical protein